jgi:hypothetical protein
VAGTAGVAGLIVEGYALGIALHSQWGWIDRLLAVAAFVVIGAATIGWSIVGSLWLHQQAQARPRSTETVTEIAPTRQAVADPPAA